MASTSNPNPDTKGKEVPPPPNLTPEQIQQIMGALTGEAGTQRSLKSRDPAHFTANGINFEVGWPSCQSTSKESDGNSTTTTTKLSTLSAF